MGHPDGPVGARKNRLPPLPSSSLASQLLVDFLGSLGTCDGSATFLLKSAEVAANGLGVVVEALRIGVTNGPDFSDDLILPLVHSLVLHQFFRCTDYYRLVA